jgi:hypothetical protein
MHLLPDLSFARRTRLCGLEWTSTWTWRTLSGAIFIYGLHLACVVVLPRSICMWPQHSPQVHNTAPAVGSSMLRHRRINFNSNPNGPRSNRSFLGAQPSPTRLPRHRGGTDPCNPRHPSTAGELSTQGGAPSSAALRLCGRAGSRRAEELNAPPTHNTAPSHKLSIHSSLSQTQHQQRRCIITTMPPPCIYSSSSSASGASGASSPSSPAKMSAM